MKDFEAAAEQALARYRELRRDARNIQERMREISGTAVSKRQTVKVTVDVHGAITALEFPTGAYKRMTPTELAEAIKPWHEYTAFAMAALVVLHVAAVVKHQLVDRDGLVERMLPGGRSSP